MLCWCVNEENGIRGTSFGVSFGAHRIMAVHIYMWIILMCDLALTVQPTDTALVNQSRCTNFGD